MIEVVVVYDRTEEKWFVTEGHKDISSHRLKQRAEKEGRRYAKNHRPAEFVVETKSGDVSYTQVYEQ